ncbi:MAG: hypothetical protein LBQ84_05910 [Flavobacteriaceae bacterium]|jgi:nucleoid DNA-binding protein|nr:hypothetical protein [Flavobacteriaceae bacterium]
MDVVKYIIQLLDEFHQITLPSFGKFELVFNSAKSDSDAGKIYPPNYEISFSQQHNLNDDNAAQEIAKAESLDIEDARTEIRRIISDWKKTLKTEGSLTLDTLGIFSSEKEKITFRMGDDCIFNFKNFGLPVITKNYYP